MNTTLAAFLYLLAAMAFIIGLKRLQSPVTARRGNQLAAFGMLVAIVVTLLVTEIISPWIVVAGLVVGGAVGGFLARTVEMTAMPQLVAAFNGFGGGASALVAAAEFLRSDALPLRTDITIVTNSLPAIIELAGTGPRLIVIGGELRPLSQALVGPLSTKVLDELYLDHAFVGTFSLSLDAGLTTTDPAEAFTKEHVLAHTREAVLLVDGSKLGTRSFAHAGRLDQIDVVITDDELDEEASQTFEHAGIRVLVA